MTTSASTPITPLAERLERTWETPRTLVGWFSTVDHKRIGKRYLVTAFAFFLLGGLEASAMRAQLARPAEHLLSPGFYNQLFTMHGVTMLFLYAAPVLSGFSNYFWPLFIGARDMAFPRLNAFSYWVFLLSGVFLYTSFLVGQAPNGGWFAYTPLTEAAYTPGLNLDYYTLGLLFLGISTTVGAINFIATLFALRAPGLSINRLPIYMWGTLTTSVSILFALPALSAACAMLYMDRRVGTHFFDPSHGGHTLLWQHLFWIFGHPWVYILVLPAMGAVSTIIPVFSRRPLVAYPLVALSTVATGILGFGVWVHHMFATGLPTISISFFSAASMVITIPSGVAFAAWIATLWTGRPVMRVPLVFMLGFLVLFVLGGVSGVMVGVIPFDWQVTDSYFVVAHLHYVLLGINLFPVLGACYYWLPKITGRMPSRRLGLWTFWLMFLGTNVTFFPMHVLGLLGMPRRIYTYPSGMGWGGLNLVESIGVVIVATGLVLFFISVVRTIRSGPPAGDNPWGASTLEWSIASPPPAYNFEVIPTVRSRDPLWEPRVTEDATRAESELREGAALDQGRETMGTTLLDAQPNAVYRMPGDSLWPLLTALALGLLFTGLLLTSVVLTVGGLAATIATAIGWLWPEHIPASRAPDAAARARA